MDYRKRIERYSRRLWCEKDLSAVDELFTEDTCIHSPIEMKQGIKAMKQIVSAWLEAFPDLYVKHTAFITEGERVAYQWMATATHQGNFRGIEATGLPICYTGVSVYQFNRNRISDYWAYVNLHQLTEQLKKPIDPIKDIRKSTEALLSTCSEPQ